VPTSSSLIGRISRAACSWLPVVGLVRPPGRPQGISAIVRVRDEEEWLDASIRSIIGFADQIVIGDNGSRDRTPMIIERLRQEFPDLIEALVLPDADICALTNALIARTRYRWIIRWDADFVAHTTGPVRISRFREWLFGLPPRRYYMIYPRMVELTGDLWHQDPTNPTRADAHCWTASESVRYVYDARGYESPRVPRWYLVRRWEMPCFYHVNVKSDDRMFFNYAWKRYLVNPRRRKCSDISAYIDHLLVTEFGGRDLPRAAQEWVNRRVQQLVPIDHTRFPDYPELLGPALARPRYQIIDQGGRIVGRSTLEHATVTTEDADAS